ncbi:MAG: hypothetical protein Q9165_005199 [Trypethelium subeluteriae]
MVTAYVIGLLFALLILYLVHVNNGLNHVPEEARKLSAPEWTDEEIRRTYRLVCENPIDFTSHLPPKLERRYVVVGGSGLVGGFIVLHLLARGQPPESIRIVDFRKPIRADLGRENAKDVQFAQADITSLESTTAAFEKPWPSKVASLPLTVFHTAAAIRPGERSLSLINRVSKVNVTGTENVISAAKKVGADVFVATSSGSISIRPVNFWIPPWKKMPDNYVQVFKDPDQDQNIRPHGTYFANYAMTKAQAEDIVLKANGPSFRTGVIRPACQVYGNRHDLCLSFHMDRGKIESWIAHCTQNSVSAANISLSHLLYEAALASPPPPSPTSHPPSGRAFAITDPNPPPTFNSLYHLLEVLRGCQTTHLPPVLMLLLAHAIEAYILTLHAVPSLTQVLGLREPTGLIALVQPATMNSSCIHQFASGAQAEQPVEQGGLGYRGVCTTLEGMCMQVREFELEGKGAGWDIGGTALGIPAKK